METHPFGALSLTPPILAIVLAIVTRRIVLSLLLGIFAGALVMAHGNPLVALAQTWETHLWAVLIDAGKMRMFSFTLLMGAMIGVITRSGGMQGLVQLVSPYANTRRRGQLATWLLGIMVFFDDYANTMLLGSTLQPIYQRLRISREKLAYVVDSTAAPVAALAPLSTWVAIEIDSIASGLESIPDFQVGAFGLFIASIPYRFYVWMALLLVPLTAILGRDFRSMHRAEKRTLDGLDDNQVSGGFTEQSAATSWIHAMLPIAATLIVVIWFVDSTGRGSASVSAADAVMSAVEPYGDQLDASLLRALNESAQAGDIAATKAAIRDISAAMESLEVGSGLPAVSAPKLSLMDVFGAADSSVALQYGALVGLGLALLMSWGIRILSFDEALAGAFQGARVVLPAVAILWCAATMSRMTTNKSVDGEATTTPYEFRDHRLYTADYLTRILTGQGSEDDGSTADRSRTNSGVASAKYFPTIVFLLAGAVAFCTGTSWGTMGILLPMVVQTAYALLQSEGVDVSANDPILVSSIGGVLAGAVFGDHCSPISDTTVLSSQWSGCDHLAHVWTQLPYAALAAAVSVLLGTLPLGFGVPVWLLLPLQLMGMLIVLRFLGRKSF